VTIIGAGAIELADGGTCPPISDNMGEGGTTEFMGHLQLYEASPNFGIPTYANMV